MNIISTGPETGAGENVREGPEPGVIGVWFSLMPRGDGERDPEPFGRWRGVEGIETDCLEPLVLDGMVPRSGCATGDLPDVGLVPWRSSPVLRQRSCGSELNGRSKTVQGRRRRDVWEARGA